jgi:hypothetical protein
MKQLFLGIILICLYCTALAQTDQYQYFNKSWKPVPKDSAFYYSQFYSLDGQFKRKDFLFATNSLQMDGAFADREMKTRHGITTWYYENSSLRDSVLYDKGKKIAGWYFYENGSRKAIFTSTDGTAVEQKGWDENGVEISNYVIEKPAEFPGGKEGWKRYLERNLNANVAADARAPDGNYPVKVSFVVDEKGRISDVNTVSYPPACAPCGVEAIRVIQRGPDWIPAVQFGKPVIYKGIQTITFQVSTR